METKPTPAPQLSIAELLPNEALAVLRDAYRPDDMIGSAGATLTRLFPKSKQYIEAILAEYQGGDDLAPKDRERCVISILTTQRSALELAVHIYWGLMEKLDPTEIANTLLLTGAYSGVPNFTVAMFTLRDTLGVLGDLAKQGGDAVSPKMVLRTLLEKIH